MEHLSYDYFLERARELVTRLRTNEEQGFRGVDDYLLMAEKNVEIEEKQLLWAKMSLKALLVAIDEDRQRQEDAKKEPPPAAS